MTMRRFPQLLAAVVLLTASAALAQTNPAPSGSSTLDAVRQHGVLACGVSGTTPGFSYPDREGVLRGYDADLCRAVAAAALGDASKVKFVILTSVNRFTALQSGEVDLLARVVTWTLTREARLGLLFANIYFYDGTGFLVKTRAGVKSALDLDGATICMLPGTSTELAVQDWFRTKGKTFTPVLIGGTAELRTAFLEGRCDAYSTDTSSLAGFRYSLGPRRDDVTLLPEVIDKEPLAPAVRKGDDKWFDLVRWTQFSMATAEELGITSANVDQALASKSPDVRRLLGLEGELGTALGVDNQWAYHVIKQVGNAEELWDRDLAPLGLTRGHNALWTKGGLEYAPPVQ